MSLGEVEDVRQEGFLLLQHGDPRRQLPLFLAVLLQIRRSLRYVPRSERGS